MTWIKMRTDLADDPAVISMAEALSIDRDLAVGKLHRLWSWADSQTETGRVKGITETQIDALVAQNGFAKQMERVGWLNLQKHGVTFPRFTRHNAQSAKRRALTAKRNRSYRRRTKRHASVTPASRSAHLEERRGEKRIPPPLPPPSETESGGGGGGVQCDFTEEDRGDYGTGYKQPADIIRSMLSMAGVMSERVRRRIAKRDGITPAIVYEAVEHARTNNGGPGLIVSLLDHDLADMRHRAEKRESTSAATAQALDAQQQCQAAGWDGVELRAVDLAALAAIPAEDRDALIREVHGDAAAEQMQTQSGVQSVFWAWERRKHNKRKESTHE